MEQSNIVQENNFSTQDLFKGFIQKKIEQINAGIEDCTFELEQSKARFINLTRDIELKRFEILDLENYKEKMGNSLNKQIEEIKSLPFVKGIEMIKEGLRVDVGDIYIVNRVKKVYIGEFDVLITPSKVQIKNRNPIDIGGRYWLDHPHISGGSICYGGERGIKIQEYFAKFELKKLIYFVYLFLRSCNSEDKYHSLAHWIKKDVVRKYEIKVPKYLKERKPIKNEIGCEMEEKNDNDRN